MILRKIKKIIIVTTIGTIFCSVGLNQSFANDLNNSKDVFDLSSEDNQEVSIIKSEYEMVKELQNLGEKSLKKNNYTDEQIKDIYNYENKLREHINEMNKLSNYELEGLDYTDEQINIIRNYNGSEDEIATVSASVETTITKKSSTSTSTKSTLSVLARFVWRGVPVVQFNDAFAISNGEGMYYDKENTPFTTTYTSSTGGQKTYSGYLKRAGAGNTGASTQFPVYRSEVVKYYLRSGSANVGMNRSSKVTQCGIGISYGHSGISISGISVSFSGVSISFGGKVTPSSTSRVIIL